MSQTSQPGRALSYALFHVDLRVEVPGFLPKSSRLFRFAGLAFQHRQAADGVCQIEWSSVSAGAIELEGLAVARLSQFWMAGFVMHIAKMTNRVRQREPVSVLAVKSYGLFVVVARSRVVVQLSLDFSQQA